MSPAHQRGLLLLQQGRFDRADREFRQHLAQMPDDPLAHAFLSLCLSRTKRGDEALAEATEAVRCGPNLAFCHYVRGAALQEKKRLVEAEAAARSAIQLDPDDADYPALLASIAMERRDWKGALEAANRGLELDPEQSACLNLRAMALVQLGRKDEAAKTLGSALADDPENALTHANQGWALLHQGKHAEALEHFREALRIDPDLDWARTGIVEALKARFLIYRVMLRFFLWMGRQSAIGQWVVILGIMFGQQALGQVARSVPWLSPFIKPILALLFGFVIMTWIASPLFNLTLRFNRFGRLALTEEARVESNWIGGFFLLAAGFFVANLVTGSADTFLLMTFFGLMLFPITVTFRQSPGTPRLLASAGTAVLGLLGAISLTFILQDIGKVGGYSTIKMYQAFLTGSMLSTWAGAFFGRGAVGR
jgi:tetratricopeptide (TPR) repeat protein